MKGWDDNLLHRLISLDPGFRPGWRLDTQFPHADIASKTNGEQEDNHMLILHNLIFHIWRHGNCVYHNLITPNIMHRHYLLHHIFYVLTEFNLYHIASRFKDPVLHSLTLRPAFKQYSFACVTLSGNRAMLSRDRRHPGGPDDPAKAVWTRHCCLQAQCW